MTTTTDSRRPGRFAGLNPTARRTERRRLLLDAAFDLLATEGTSGTTVRAVCARAELNPRYFYESFASLDELAVAVYDRVSDEFGRGLVAAMDTAEPDLPSQVRAGMRHTVAFLDDDRRRARILYVEPVGNAALNRRRTEAGRDLALFLEEDARRRRRAAPPGDAMGALTTGMLVGGVSEVLTAWVDGRVRVGRKQLVDDMTALVLGLLETAATVVGSRATASHRSGGRAPTRRVEASSGGAADPAPPVGAAHSYSSAPATKSSPRRSSS